MQRVRKWVAALAGDERGLTTVEYAIVLCLIAVVGVGTWSTFGTMVKTNLGNASDGLDGYLSGDGSGEPGSS